jgi:hypothetical protein
MIVDDQDTRHACLITTGLRKTALPITDLRTRETQLPVAASSPRKEGLQTGCRADTRPAEPQWAENSRTAAVVIASAVADTDVD